MSVTAYDSNGNIIVCDKCKKPAGYHLIGQSFAVNLCGDHSPYESAPAYAFVYRPPDPNAKPLVTEHKYESDWVINIRPKEEDGQDS